MSAPSPNTVNSLETIDVVILAGGLGTRVSSILKDTPKVLAPIDGRPYLEHLIDRLTGFGARRILLLIGHLADAVKTHIETNPRPDCEIISIIEPEPMGTAGALRLARDHFNSNPVMVMNGDSFVDANLCDFLNNHIASEAEGSLLCTKVDDAGRYGRIDCDEDDRIIRFVEKDPDFHGEGLVNAGIYLFNTAMLDYIALSFGASLEHDIFEKLPERHLNAYAGTFTFIDIGTPESLALAPEVFRRIS